MEISEKDIKKKSKRMKSIPKNPAATESTCASHPYASANIRTDVEQTIHNLQQLSTSYRDSHKNDVRGVLTDLWNALGINTSDESSRYAYFLLPDGTKLCISVRISNHNAKCKNYIGKFHCDENFIFVIQRQKRGNSFEQHPMIEAKEYVFVEQIAREKGVECFASKIVDSIISVLQTGTFYDYTGVAIPHESHSFITMTDIAQYEEPTFSSNEQPQFVTTITNENKANSNMKKSIIKLNEAQLRGIISESLKMMLKEEAAEVPYYIDDIVKIAYKLRHKIHEVYDMCPWECNDNWEEHNSHKLSHNILEPKPYGELKNSYVSEIEKTIYESYYIVNKLINDLIFAKNKFITDDNAEWEKYQSI